MEGFKKFLLRGNVVELAVAVAIGAAFTNIVNVLVRALILPFIGMFGGVPDFSSTTVTVNNSRFLIGELLNAILFFLIIATVIYFFVVLPMNALMDRIREVPVKTRECPECLSKIPVGARRCAFCTAEVVPEVGVAEQAATRR